MTVALVPELVAVVTTDVAVGKRSISGDDQLNWILRWIVAKRTRSS